MDIQKSGLGRDVDDDFGSVRNWCRLFECSSQGFLFSYHLNR